MAQLQDIVNDKKVFKKAKDGFKKEKKLLPKHFFIDESGRPEFYANGKKLLIDQPGYSKCSFNWDG